MSEQNSRIIIAKNIKLDKEYNNVLTYSSNEMLALVSANAVSSSSDFSFIRKSKNQISTSFNYSQCLTSNYLAFQNPFFNSKWFFAWIDEVEYISDSCTQLTYTIDIFSTFYDDWSRKPCYIIRQHSVTDNIGENTQPEDLNLGSSYINYSNAQYPFASSVRPMRFGMLTSGSAEPDYNSSYQTVELFNGVLTALHPNMGIPVTDTTAIQSLLTPYLKNGTENRVVKVFQYPSLLGDVSSAKNVFQDRMEVSKPIFLDGYIPKNNKLFTFPYVKIRMYSYTGESIELQCENFSSEKCIFKIRGASFPTCQFKIFPCDYAGEDNDYTKTIVSNASIEVSFTGNAYAQWLANNQISEGIGLAVSAIGSIGSIAAGATTGNPALVASGVISAGTSIASTLNDFEVAKNQSSTVHGSISAGGLNIHDGTFGFSIDVLTIKKEYAEQIDRYFTRFGYAVNSVETPNLDSRPIFNYLKIASNSNIGYGNVPSMYMDTINNIFRRGTTLWHNHSQIGDFNLDNSI